MTKNEATLQQARVLQRVEIQGVVYQPNDVVEVNEKTLFYLRGSLDANPDAVAYALKLKARFRQRAQLEAELTCFE